jgi:hypothetical protein
VTADHLDELFATITNAYPQLSAEVSQIQAQLSPYLSTTTQGGQTLAVHTVYGDGTVTVNGQKAGDLPKLDWTSLENPAPPPPSQ